MLKFPTMIMNFPISPFSFVSFVSMYFKAILLGKYTHFNYCLVAMQEIIICTTDIKIQYYLVIPSSQTMQEFRDLKTLSISTYLSVYLIYSSLIILPLLWYILISYICYIPQDIYYCFHCSSFLPTCLTFYCGICLCLPKEHCVVFPLVCVCGYEFLFN